MRANDFHHLHSPSLPTTSSDVMLFCSFFAKFQIQVAASDRMACKSLEAVAHDFISEVQREILQSWPGQLADGATNFDYDCQTQVISACFQTLANARLLGQLHADSIF